MSAFSHLDSKAKNAHMVDVGQKKESKRVAKALARVRLSPALLEALQKEKLEKGEPLSVARIAGIMAAKQTHTLLPLCHPLPIEKISLKLELESSLPALNIEATVSTTAKTGVEMEALTAASVAALTFYDMCKAVDKSLWIEGVFLAEKTGGKSGNFSHPSPPFSFK